MGRGNDEELYLLKLFNNGNFSVIRWTPITAKKGFTVMTKEKAAPYLKLAQMGKGHIDNVKDKAFINSIKNVFEVSGKAGRNLADKKEARRLADLEAIDASNTDGIVKDVVKNTVKSQTFDDSEVRELSVSQESIQIKEARYIKGLQHKSTLESHMLEKYQCAIPAGKLDTMKVLANSMISDLAKKNRLYLIDDKVTTN